MLLYYFMIFISKCRKDIFIFKYKASIYEVIKWKLLCRRVLQNTSKRPPQWNFSYVFRWFHGTIPFFPAAFFGGTGSFETLIKHMPIISGILSFLQWGRRRKRLWGEAIILLVCACKKFHNRKKNIFLGYFFQFQFSDEVWYPKTKSQLGD